MPLTTRASALSDIGRRRARNEDTVEVDAPLGIAVVADGMGGHPSGDVASVLAATEAVRLLRGVWGAAPPEGASPELLREGMEDTVRRADERVREACLEDPAREGMGTTLTALLVDARSGTGVIGHVGDSRVYRLRDGRLQPLTRDHTWVREQVEAGRMSAERARGHRYAGVLTQAIGADEPPRPDVIAVEPRAGDVYLLCSDGLSGMVEDERIEALLLEHLPALDRAAAALVDAANRAGGRDNVSVALVAVDGRPSEA